MNPKAIQSLFTYHYWASERMWHGVMQLTETQFIQPIEYSSGAIRNHIVHLMNSTRRWMKRLQRTAVPAHIPSDAFPTPRAAKSTWDELRTETMDYIHTLTQDHLEEIVAWEIPGRGLRHRNPRWEILLHVINHATDHRAQVLTLLNHLFHLETLEQDFLFYLLEAV